MNNDVLNLKSSLDRIAKERESALDRNELLSLLSKSSEFEKNKIYEKIEREREIMLRCAHAQLERDLSHLSRIAKDKHALCKRLSYKRFKETLDNFEFNSDLFALNELRKKI